MAERGNRKRGKRHYKRPKTKRTLDGTTSPDPDLPSIVLTTPENASDLLFPPVSRFATQSLLDPTSYEESINAIARAGSKDEEKEELEEELEEETEEEVEEDGKDGEDEEDEENQGFRIRGLAASAPLSAFGFLSPVQQVIEQNIDGTASTVRRAESRKASNNKPDLSILGLASRKANTAAAPTASPADATSATTSQAVATTSATNKMTTGKIETDPMNIAVRAVRETADRTREHVFEMLKMKEDAENDPNVDVAAVNLELARKTKVLHAHLAKLRGLHRNLILNMRKEKQKTADARQEVDKLHLELQNLKYEENHLKKSITVYENFELVLSTSSSLKLETNIHSSHPYQSLPLLPVEQFLELHPEHKDLEEQELTLARIQHEYDQRDAAKKKQMGLLKRKEELMHENSKQKTELDKLDKQMEDFALSSKAVQETFDKATAKKEAELKKEADAKEAEAKKDIAMIE